MIGADAAEWPEGRLAYLKGGWLAPWDGVAVPEGALRVRDELGVWRYTDGRGGVVEEGKFTVVPSKPDKPMRRRKGN